MGTATRFKQSVLVFCLLQFSYAVKSQSNSSDFGYLDHGDSVEFVFGQQKTLVAGGFLIYMKERYHQIKSVNVAGDFNAWNPKDPKFVAVPGMDHLFRLHVAKKQLGKKGETHQFKFVLNEVYWVEPPDDAVNRFTGKDHNTNLTLQL